MIAVNCCNLTKANYNRTKKARSRAKMPPKADTAFLFARNTLKPEKKILGLMLFNIFINNLETGWNAPSAKLMNDIIVGRLADTSSAEKDPILVEKLNTSNQCTCVAMNANHILGSTNSSVDSRSSDYSYCPVLKRCLEDCVQFCIFSIREICKRERVQ
ncbi:hypothetical protein QYF61_026589 [Mycteria americana]|uniref:Uncharacterized protein n=1 Tax=Mycteria americana TaxID=33587 RepID=A0AAN7NN26_MYCAM|nr:hypothetical protein QYF61_026589 [Mycteria americana]